MGLPAIWPTGSNNTAAAAVPGFTKTYNCDKLVWFERFDDLQDARLFEWRIKKWKRAWKVSRIVERNPEWNDLFEADLQP